MQAAVSRCGVALVVLLGARLAHADPADEAKVKPAPSESDASQVGEEVPSPDDEAAAEETQTPSSEVVIIGDTADAMQSVPGSATIIRPEEIERAQAYDAAELLRRIPGANVRQDPGAGGRLDIGFRGLDPGRSRRVLMLEDGVPLAINPYAEPDLYYAPPIERWQAIEALKGSGSILFGPQTVGGVINGITPYAPDHRVVRIEALGGQREFFQGMARYGDAVGPARFLAQILYRRGEGYRAQGFSTLNTFGKVTFETGDTGEMTVKIGFHNDEADSDDVGLTPAMFAEAPDRLTIAPHNFATTRRYDVSLTHDQMLGEYASLRTLAYAYTLTRQWRRQLYDRYPVEGAAYERIVGDADVPGGAIFFRYENRILDRTYDVAGLEPRLEVRFPTGDVEHTVSVGSRVLVEAAHYEQREGESPTSDAGALTLDEQRTSLAFAGYVQDRIGFWNERVLVTPGVRFEHVRYQYHVGRQPESDGAVDVDIEGDNEDTAVIPGIGLTVGTPDYHGFAGVHVGYAPPRAASSIRALGGTVELDDERSIAYEAGARLRGMRREGERTDKLWELEATGYLSNFTNQIIPGTGGAVTELVNGGATQHVGLESAGGLALGSLFRIPLIIDVTARYTLSRAEFSNGPFVGNVLPYAPAHLVYAALDLAHDIGVGGQFSYSYVSEQLADDANTEEEDVTGRLGRIDGYHVLDASLRYTNAFTGLTASVRVKNLLDDPYIIARRPEGIFTSGMRQVVFGLRWDYDGASAQSSTEAQPSAVESSAVESSAVESSAVESSAKKGR
jgi:Fe(3+) dicitrate transport protein